MKKSLPISFPHYWLLRAALSLLKLVARLPLKWQFRLGTLLGSILYYFPTKLKHISKVNLQLCFPLLTDEKRNVLLRKNFKAVGIGMMETAMAWWAPEKNLKFTNTIHGIEHVEAALKKGKGVLLVGPHFMCLEMIGRLMANQYDFAVMYRPHKNPFIATLQEELRQKKIHYIPRSNMRALIRALESNKAIWYAYDVDGGAKRSVFAPFFNIPTASLTAVTRIIKLIDTTVIPIRFYRREDNTGYEIVLSPALNDFPSGDDVEDAARLNQLLEAAIRENPDQYIWQYKRFKTRPQGEKRFY